MEGGDRFFIAMVTFVFILIVLGLVLGFLMTG